MMKYCYFDGKYIESSKAGVPINDLGITRAYSVFDFFRVYNTKPLHFDRNYKRLLNSAKILNIKVPISSSKLGEIVSGLLKKNKCKSAQVKIILTGGVSEDGLSRGSNPLLYIYLSDLVDFPESYYKKGCKLITEKYSRPYFEAKTTYYTRAVILQDKRRKQKAVEILYVTKGKIFEAATSNIFIVKNNKLFTPKEGILKGITRSIVIDLAKDLDIKCVEKNLSLNEALKADEIFLTAANKKVLPIVNIDNKKISNGRVGELSKKLLEEYELFVEKKSR